LIDWFPDWEGRTCAIIASGPSTKKADVPQLRGRMPVIAIKENSELAPWAEVVYGCDAAWWRNCFGLPKYNGLKVSATPVAATRHPDIHIVHVDPPSDKLLLDKPGFIGSGGNSGFQALNLAVQWGAKRIILVGFDMSDEFGVHWYGRNSGTGRANPGPWNFKRWRAAFVTASVQLRGKVEVLNASPFTALTCFPKTTFDKALAEWG